MPAVNEGLATGNKQRSDFTIAAQVIVATGMNEEEMQAAEFSARNQIAFYASTPAYLPVLQAHGWEDMQPEANRLSKEGKWAELASLVNDEILHTFALVGEPAEIARKLHDRFEGKVERVSPVIYSPSSDLLSTLLSEIKSVGGAS